MKALLTETKMIVDRFCLGLLGIRQEFTHVAKAEENTHSDIYHINKLPQYITYFFTGDDTFVSLSFYLTLYVQSQPLN